MHQYVNSRGVYGGAYVDGARLSLTQLPALKFTVRCDLDSGGFSRSMDFLGLDSAHFCSVDASIANSISNLSAEVFHFRKTPLPGLLIVGPSAPKVSSSTSQVMISKGPPVRLAMNQSDRRKSKESELALHES